jgi:hypothetical protein
MMFALITTLALRCLYWLLPVPYAEGADEAEGSSNRPGQLEYG